MLPTVPFWSLAAVWPDRPVRAGCLRSKLKGLKPKWDVDPAPEHPHDDLMVEGVLSCAHDLRVRRRALLVASLPRVEKGGVGSGRELVQRLA